ncbi:BMC domain-containing protein [Clostridium sp. D2Q-14]|uniref:BMC domain-containing protein n=1 Tax=Anaeromonas gelatinilytica TaxID=2683194 RepID=UPI001BB3BD3B|nr:BMC domain-containing protein [Anaeromonas gelatinilytica]MBS4534542.1 BMC domain-containing protein [Anaeromonas gelatinilytica]
MYKFALGMIETVGLAAGIEAADTAVKSANIKLLGYELTKGHGLVTVKFAGDVGAVKSALEAGSAAAEKVNKVWSKLVIPRPHDEIQGLIKSMETVGLFNVDTKKEEQEKEQENKEIENKEKEIPSINLKDVKELENQYKMDRSEEDSSKIDKNIKKEDICNICGDPKCPRKKGESRSLCIHNKNKRRN